MAAFIDQNGETQQISLSASIYREAALAGHSVETHLNLAYPVAAGQPSAFEQLCASEGMFIGRNKAFGIRPATMDAVLNGSAISAAGVVRDATPASRILFPAYQLSAIENKLRSNDYGVVGQFDAAAAVTDTIDSERFERPVLDFSKPEAARSKATAQLSEPTSMLSITASDKAFRITGTAIGMEISDQAMRGTSLDLVNLAMTRQAETELVEKVEQMQLAFLNGDKDLDMAALSTVSGAIATAASFDSAIVAAGVLSQKAWVYYLFNNSRKRRIDYVITDLAGALAIENRTGRPNVQGDNATSKRIDTLENVINPMWPDQVKVFISMDPSWPANTILGFDSRYSYHVVNSSVLDYQAAEAYAMRRSTKFRIDTGKIAYRLFDDSWNVLTLTV
jgi:hypothetical protein